ncbi:SDR family oxidoreductase [Phytoactinopolyspora halotolerans]|uniref:SDR family oxidoreductase n=1 Tax=Phytoactinopolyspora halotolerans TaxID=1981512 RepID=A0A6L9SDE6_9ACTN|nr:SDR family oxidoreductase [Phytoactinopolyspora halotolerans]NEE02592.1 SDR family oxidoreductase [Phytoactinopolyspora halotolerans]
MARMKVLVTGGTGVLGRELTHRLRDHAEVRVLSRRPAQDTGSVQGDLETGEGLVAAVEGVDAIAHCASAADYRRPQRDVAQTQRLLDAVGGERPHIVYISIVGADRVPFGFLRAKLEAERLVEESGLPWTTLRATQFHDLMLMFVMRLCKAPVAVVPRGSLFQPVDVGDVAERMVELIMGQPAGHVRELGGPKVESMTDLIRTYLTATHRRRSMVAIPVPGRLRTAFGVGGQLLTDGDQGTVTFENYLRSRGTADGIIKHPYGH